MKKFINGGFERRPTLGSYPNDRLTGVWFVAGRLLVRFAYTAAIGMRTYRETTFEITWRHPDLDYRRSPFDTIEKYIEREQTSGR